MKRECLLMKSINYLIYYFIKMPKKKVTRQQCEVYSRVVGYLSPVAQWNIGKKTEWEDRKVFSV